MKVLPSFQLMAIAAVVGLVLGAAGAWRVTSWHYQAEEAKALRDAVALERGGYQSVITNLKQQITDSVEASRGYQNELSTLRAERRRPAPAVRVCIDPAGSADPVFGTGAVSAGSDGAAPATGVVSPRAGPDIGPELYTTIDRCDDLSAQLRALQDRVRRLTGQP